MKQSLVGGVILVLILAVLVGNGIMQSGFLSQFVFIPPTVTVSVMVSPSRSAYDVGTTVSVSGRVTSMSPAYETSGRTVGVKVDASTNMAGPWTRIWSGDDITDDSGAYSHIMTLPPPPGASEWWKYRFTATVTGATSGTAYLNVCRSGNCGTTTSTVTSSSVSFEVYFTFKNEIQIQQGGMNQQVIPVTYSGAPKQTVTFSCIGGFGDGILCAFNPPSGTPPFETTLTVTVSPATPVGVYPMSLNALYTRDSVSSGITVTVVPAGATGATTTHTEAHSTTVSKTSQATTSKTTQSQTTQTRTTLTTSGGQTKVVTVTETLASVPRTVISGSSIRTETVRITVTETPREGTTTDPFAWFTGATYEVPNWLIFGIILTVICYLIYRRVFRKKKRSIR